MIDVECYTNLDNYKQKIWPTKMTCRPLVGDLVQASCGYSLLKITGITHTMVMKEFQDCIQKRPCLIIELNH